MEKEKKGTPLSYKVSFDVVTDRGVNTFNDTLYKCAQILRQEERVRLEQEDIFYEIWIEEIGLDPEDKRPCDGRYDIWKRIGSAEKKNNRPEWLSCKKDLNSAVLYATDKIRNCLKFQYELTNTPAAEEEPSRLANILEFEDEE
jgi:hypothetical protein